MKTLQKNNLIPLYVVMISLTAVAMGFSDSIMANYYMDAYETTAQQRGFIEIPRELPGIIGLLVTAALARLGDIRITWIAQILCAVGIAILGVWTPEFYTMSFILFIYSLGQHIYIPLADGLAMSIVKEKNMGTAMGNFKGIYTVFSLVASVVVFVGFRYGWFSFKTKYKLIFLIAAGLFVLAAVVLSVMSRKAKMEKRIADKPKMVFRKEYIYYYILSIMNGVQKQIVFVYAPWVIIEILGKGADTTAILLIISSVCGIFFMPFLGRCIDRFGLKKMFYADALSYILVYVSFAFIVYHMYVGNFSTTGLAAIATFLVFIFDRMSSQMGIIRTVYLKRIAVDDQDVLPTISLGFAMDHVVAICCAYFSGYIWMAYGPHVIFLMVAALSLVNLVVAKVIKIPPIQGISQ